MPAPYLKTIDPKDPRPNRFPSGFLEEPVVTYLYGREYAERRKAEIDEKGGRFGDVAIPPREWGEASEGWLGRLR